MTDQSSIPELLPCPFCGGHDLAHDKSKVGNSFVECNSCGAFGPDEWERQAWNTRALTTAPVTPQQAAWQPIETAPEDKAVIGRKENEVRTTWLVNYHYTGPRWTYEAFDQLSQWKPTHWMPIGAIAGDGE